MGSGSGTPASLARALRQLGHTVITRDVEVSGLTRALTLARSWSPDRARWVAGYHLRKAAFGARSVNARRAARTSGQVDAILQYGGTFDSTGLGIPVYLFCDSNTLFSSKQPASWGASLSSAGLAEAVGLEAHLYQHASGIFTMSEYIAESFRADFNIDRHRVLAVGAGPNADPEQLIAIDRIGNRTDRAPTILFIGREFERKGGDVLVNAFAKVRGEIPDARLVIVGPKERVELPDGAEWLGFLDRTDARDWEVLRAAFASATVFTLPARHEPFGLVVLEAMYAALPVVATRIGALEEMVVDGSTGTLVTPEQVDELSDALIALLQQDRALAFGQAGRARAIASYSWQHVAAQIAKTMSRDASEGITLSRHA